MCFSAFFVLFATMFPTLASDLRPTAVLRSPPFFNKVDDAVLLIAFSLALAASCFRKSALAMSATVLLLPGLASSCRRRPGDFVPSLWPPVLSRFAVWVSALAQEFFARRSSVALDRIVVVTLSSTLRAIAPALRRVCRHLVIV